LSSDRITKKQLKSDSFITSTLKAWEYARMHQNTLFVALVIIIVVIAGAVYIGNTRRQSREEARSLFGEALTYYMAGQVPAAEQRFEQVHDRASGSRESSFALYFLGKCALIEGRNLEAIEAFDSYLKAVSDSGFFRDAALAGKASALENERRFKEAAELYLGLARHPETNAFNKKEYLTSAALNFKKGHETDMALEAMEELLETATGIEKRDLEIEMAILRE
jgi:tetratricopeptide (TPR) repeat protein